MRASLRWVAGVCFVLGCARGASVDELDASTTDDSISLGGNQDAGHADESPSSDEPSDEEGNRSSAKPDANDDRPKIDAGTSVETCLPPVSCEAAKAAGIPNLGSIEWAKTGLIASKTEAGSRWYLVGVTGDSASEIVKGGIEARLQSPPGSNYDLYLYGGAKGYNTGLDTCEGPQASSKNPGDAADSATQVWAAAAFGALTNRWVTVEVRHMEGPCANFTLELHGAKQ